MKRHNQGRRKKGSARRRRSWLGRALGLRGPKTRTSHYEIAVPALRRDVDRRSLPPRLINALVLVVAGWLLYWFSSADLFYITGLQIKGESIFSEAELMTVAGLDGVNIFWVDTRTVERAIEALPEVEAARVRCRLPAECVVRLVEKQALFVWRQGDADVWIAAEGTVLPARGELPNAIVMDAGASTALRPGDQLDPALVAAVRDLERLQPEVRLYQFTDQYGLSFRNAYGWLVRLGHGQKTETKLNLMRALSDYLASRGIAPTFIDVRFPEAPYYVEQSGFIDSELSDPNAARISQAFPLFARPGVGRMEGI